MNNYHGRIFLFLVSFVKSRGVGELAWVIEIRSDCLARGLCQQDLGSLSLSSASIDFHSQKHLHLGG